MDDIVELTCCGSSALSRAAPSLADREAAIWLKLDPDIDCSYDSLTKFCILCNGTGIMGGRRSPVLLLSIFYFAIIILTIAAVIYN